MVHLTKRPATTGRERGIKAQYKSSTSKPSKNIHQVLVLVERHHKLMLEKNM